MSDDEYAELMRAILLGDPLHGLPREPSRLQNHIYIGSQANAESLKLLQQLGITHVLNCAGFKGPRINGGSPYEGLNIDYYEFQAEDTDRYDISRHFAEAFSYLDKVRRHGGTALVHCALGINRSGAVCLGYLMHDTRMTLLEATKILKGKRRIVLANKAFQRQLVRFARTRGFLDKIDKSSESHVNNNHHQRDSDRPYHDDEDNNLPKGRAAHRSTTTKSKSDAARRYDSILRDPLRLAPRDDTVSNLRLSRRDMSAATVTPRWSSRADLSRDHRASIGWLGDSFKASAGERRTRNGPRSQSTSRLSATANSNSLFTLPGSSAGPFDRYNSRTLGRMRIKEYAL